MLIEVRPGLLYFIKGKEDDRVQELVAGLRSAGYRLLVLSSRLSGEVRDTIDVPMDCVMTLTQSVGQKCLDPENLKVITDTITKFINQDGRSAFLIEDLGLLKQKNEFSELLHMIGYLYESVALNRGVGIVVIDPQTWNKKELAFLGKEGLMVEEKDRLDTKLLLSGTPRNHLSQNV
jgi:hypothetical protein